MKCGGCFHSLPDAEQTNVLQTLNTLKNVARFHRGEKVGDDLISLLILARPQTDGVRGGGSGMFAWMCVQVSLCPLDLCLWKCSVTPYGKDGQSWCNGVLCPKAFSATLEFEVNSDDERESSLMSPHLQTMHQIAFAHRQNGFQPFELRLVRNYRIVNLTTIVVDNAEECFKLDKQEAVQNDDEEEEDPRHDMLLKCMAALKSHHGDGKARAATTTRHASDEPRLKGQRRQRKTSGLGSEQLSAETLETDAESGNQRSKIGTGGEQDIAASSSVSVSGLVVSKIKMLVLFTLPVNMFAAILILTIDDMIRLSLNYRLLNSLLWI